MLLLGLLLIMLKPSFGYVTVPLAGFVIFLVLKHMSQTAEIVAAYAVTWFLLLSGVRIVVQRGVNARDAGLSQRSHEHSPAGVVRAVAGRHADRRGDRRPLDAPPGGPPRSRGAVPAPVSLFPAPPRFVTILTVHYG